MREGKKQAHKIIDVSDKIEQGASGACPTFNAPKTRKELLDSWILYRLYCI